MLSNVNLPLQFKKGSCDQRMKQAITKLVLPLVFTSGLVAQTSNNSATIYNVSTAAGSIVTGEGDGGPSGSALLLEADAVAVDRAGNIFVGDTVTGHIRRIDAVTGIITNFVNISAAGLTTDATGNLYVANTGSHNVYKLDPTGKTQTTIAGGGGNSGYSGDGGKAVPGNRAGVLNSPRGLAVDAAGNIYIADTSNNRIRKVTPAGLIFTVAGTGAATAPSIGGSPFTCSAATTTILNGAILNVGDGCPATQAILSGPFGVTLAPSGNGDFYIADTGNNRVRLVTAATGIITTVAGAGIKSTATGNFVNGLPTAVLGDGQAATSATFNAPQFITFDTNGNMFVSDNGNARIRKVTNGVISSYGPGNTNGNGIVATGFTAPRQLVVLPNGNLLVADGAQLKSIDPTQLVQTIVAGKTPFTGDGGSATTGTLLNGAVTGLAVDNSGNLFISDSGNQRIREVSGGTINTIVGSGTAASATTLGDGGIGQTARVNAPGCVAVDAGGNLYIADGGDSRIRKVSGGTINTIVGPSLGNGVTTPYPVALLRTPRCVAVDAAGVNVYFTEGNSVQKLNQQTGVVTVVAGQASLLGNNTATVTVNGVATTTITGSGVIAGASGADGDGGPAANALLNGPVGIAIGSDNTIYIADTGNQLIRRIDGVTGIISTISGVVGGGSDDATVPSVTTGVVPTRNSYGQRLNSPQGVAVDSSGNVYIANTGSGLIDKIDTNGNLFRIAGGGALPTETGTAVSNGTTSPGTQIISPSAITLDASGNVYFSDRIGLVRKLTPVANSGK
jgi:sugar lactone lactonase YvrE